MSPRSHFATAGATTPHFQDTSGTVTPAQPQTASPSERSVRVAQWLASAQARNYDGQWVLLNDSYQVTDSDPSARVLVERHSGLSDPLVVFVHPPRVRFG